MSEPGPQKPIMEFRVGTITATIWNKTVTLNGRAAAQPSVRIQKRYRDERTGEWKSTSYLRPDDLPKLGLVASKAYEYLMLRENGQDVPPQAS